MKRTYVFDHTAIVALFQGGTDVYGLFQGVERGNYQILLPASAMAEASHALGLDDPAWEAVLLTRNVKVHALDQSAAITSAQFAGEMPVRHVIYEAQEVRGIVATVAPGLYAGLAPLRVIRRLD